MILIAVVIIIALGAIAVFIMEQWRKGNKRKIVMWLLLLVLGMVGPLLARTQIARWMDCLPRNCPGANLVGRHLQHENLSNGNFVQADLSRANLYGAQLVNSFLSGAKLYSANLQRADLTGADLTGADLTNADLTGAILDGADLRGANLTRANLNGIDLTKTILLGAQLDDAGLIAADLTGANLKAVSFAGAQMNGAILGHSDLSGANLSSANLSGAHIADSLLAGAWLNLAVMIGADLTNSDLSGSSMIGANLASANLSDSSLMGSTLVGVDLDGASVNGADLRNVRTTFATLTDEDWRRDPRLAELNEGARNQIEQNETQLQAASADSRTIWNGSEAAVEVTKAQERQLLATTNAADTLKVGLLLDLGGSITTTQKSMLDAMLLAVDEINLNGGVLGRQLQPVNRSIGDDPESFARAVRELAEEGVAVIFSGATSEQRKAALPVLAETDTPLFYYPPYEGFESAPQVFYAGAEPSQYVLPAVQYLLDQDFGRVLLVGRDNLYSQTVHHIIKAQLRDTDLAVAAEVYIAGSTPDFQSLFPQIQSSAPDIIISTIGDDWSPEFYQQLTAAALDSSILPVMNLAMSEESLRLIDPSIMAGHMIAGTYFQKIETPENLSFTQAVQAAYGKERATSGLTAAAYGAIYLWQALAESAKSVDTPALRAAAATGQIEQRTPRGVLRFGADSQHTTATARIGMVESDNSITLLYESESPLEPDPYLTQFTWAARLPGELSRQAGESVGEK